MNLTGHRVTNTNTAILFTVYHGVPGSVGPHPLNTYPDDYASQGLSGSMDALGFPVGDCGSYAMFKMQQTGKRTLIHTITGYAAQWPSTVPASWLSSSVASGMVAIRPSSAQGDLGHALIVEALMPSGFTLPDGTVLPDGSFLASSYNSFQDGAYALQYWAPSGSFNGVPFSLTYINFANGDG